MGKRQAKNCLPDWLKDQTVSDFMVTFACFTPDFSLLLTLARLPSMNSSCIPVIFPEIMQTQLLPFSPFALSNLKIASS